MKYRRGGRGLRELGDLLAEAVSARCAQERLDAVVPVPMHWMRRLARGWNQSSALAQRLGRRLRLARPGSARTAALPTSVATRSSQTSLGSIQPENSALTYLTFGGHNRYCKCLF